MPLTRHPSLPASRRAFLGAAAAAACAGSLEAWPAAAKPADARAALSGPGPRSRLPWYSGVCIYDGWQEFEAWRGRPIDLMTIWGPRETWEDVAGGDDDMSLTGWFGGMFAKSIGQGYGLACSWPLIAEESHSIKADPEVWTKGAKGEFDRYYERYARKLGRFVERHGTRPIIVRVAWESNGTKYPHSVTDPYVGEWKDTFRRAVDQLRRHVPGVLIDWSSIKKGKTRTGNQDLYPGDDHVDIIGVDYYDAWPPARNERMWEKNLKTSTRGGPVGLRSWLDFAKSCGKPLSLPEYAIRADLKEGGGGDNDLYVRKLFEFIQANRAHIAYENYFNMGDKGHRVFPPRHNPRAALTYQALWRSGDLAALRGLELPPAGDVPDDDGFEGDDPS